MLAAKSMFRRIHRIACLLVVSWVVIVPTASVADDAPAVAASGEATSSSSNNSASAFSPAESRLRADVGFLADDAQEGRAPGTRGIEAAADYLAGMFKEIGLKPAPGADGYFQPFTLSGRPELGKAQELTFTHAGDEPLAGKVLTDYSPLAIGISGSFESVPVVFAGYGITAKDDAQKLDYDDYAGVDVRGKAVLIIRREPQQENEKSPFNGKQLTDFATFRHKATNAFQHGAAAVLLVNDLAELKGDAEKDSLLPLMAGGGEPNSKIPFLMLTRAFADRLLAAAGDRSLADLEEVIDKDLKPVSHRIEGLSLTGKVEIERPSTITKNVVGVLEGTGPHAEETIVVGGHYDHLGRGGMMSGSLAFLSSDIHNGADDNASGTAMVVELARRLASRRDPLPRRIVFIAFSGEERGLLGSQYYVEHPLFPLAKTVMMVNFDMVGRLSTKDELTMIGVGTSPGLEPIVDALGKSAGFTIKKVAGMTDGFGGSDHQSFYSKNIPVLFAFTGVHSDYHRPSDDSDRINYTGMARIADFSELLILDIARRPERPEFSAVKQASRPAHGPDPARVGTSVYLGTMPDYADESKEGMRIVGVREGSPADKGGLKGGDVIVEFAGKQVGTIYDFMESMNQHKPGETVDVTVKREGEKRKLSVTLGSRPSE
jgi:hypothetical protein